MGKGIGRERPPVAPDQRRQQALVVTRVTGQIGMLQHVSPMLVILIVRQQQADLVQAGRSLADEARRLAGLLPLRAYLSEQIQGSGAGPLGLSLVQTKTVDDLGNGSVAHVLVTLSLIHI